MRLDSFYTVIQVGDVARSAAFYQRHFQLESAFVSDWYVHLRSATPAAITLGIVDRRHETVPAAFRDRQAQGLILSFEVDDVDAAFERAVAAGLKIHVSLCDEPWGQRHFIVEDLDGIAIDVITPIPPHPDFAKSYVTDAAAQ